MTFEVAGGTVVGRDHVRVGKNSHDGYYWQEAGGVLAAVVCDGCGSGEHSEVGAKLGAKIIVRQMLRAYLEDRKAFQLPNAQVGVDRVARSLLIRVESIADSMGGSYSENIEEYFLFTILGALVDPTGQTLIFGCGDGIFYLNNVPTVLTSPGNAPSYLSYNLVETSQGDPELKILATDPSPKSILIGTDGASDLARFFDMPIPGKEEKIGSISQFWEKDLFFKNPFAVGHRLSLINRSVSRVDYEKKVISEMHGPLRDDTTLITIRRKTLR